MPPKPNPSKPSSKPFKPPKPKPGKKKPPPTTGTSTSNSSSTRNPPPRAPASPALEPSPSSPDPFAEEARATIPAALLTRLLHEGFARDETRMSAAATEAVGRYVETFVREAMARAAFMRAEDGGGAMRGGGEGFLEVEDLEKLAPQLLLDF